MIVVGVDLGQSRDYTAVAVCRRADSSAIWQVPHLERYPLGTNYLEAADRVIKLVSRPELARCFLAVDRTGVGAAVCDLLAARLPVGHGVRLYPVCLTAGHAVGRDGRGGLTVPKKDVIAVLQLLLQSKRLRIARELPMADVLVRELADYQVKVTAAANETFGAWREGQHDDLVLALGLAGWLGETLKIDPDEGLWELLDSAATSPQPESRYQRILHEVGLDWDDD